VNNFKPGWRNWQTQRTQNPKNGYLVGSASPNFNLLNSACLLGFIILRGNRPSGKPASTVSLYTAKVSKVSKVSVDLFAGCAIVEAWQAKSITNPDVPDAA